MPGKELDLTAEEADSLNPSSPLSPLAFGPEWQMENRREDTRARLAAGLLATLFMLLTGMALLLWNGKVTTPDAVELLKVVFAPMVTLVTAATGFYYGARGR
jgi:hypothetical protein